MSYLIPGGKPTSMVSGGRKKIHTTWDDGKEMVEEYDISTDALLLRKYREKPKIGGEGRWVVEVGEENFQSGKSDLIAESSINPVVTCIDTKGCFQWRIRNLPYPADVYQISCDVDKKQIVVRTSNKKFFKRIDLVDLQRTQLPCDPSVIEWNHANRTLVVNYKKPMQVLKLEELARSERAKLQGEKEGDVDCKQQ